MDRVVGKAMQYADRDTALFVLSDHGFCSFRRAVNLNSWLRQHGYLAVTGEATESGRYFAGVDWNRTRAYSLGLSGLYLNIKGRESQGIVARGAEARALKQELIAKLSGLRDEELATTAIRRIYATSELYRGPYPKAWSGDHCVDPLLVPGVLFCNRRIDAEDPGIEDLAPTTLQLFGIDPPAYMDGKPLCVAP
jgi:predicted AlkP superfamily phosphohydrolase/phosphomutase